ncbi:vitronectin isoform X2 [Choloepus didactylus]|uniref:vitronectin isoform X2 n=1 Tax=Choloepus didactylus TaxID=27675 RepID=UPI00189ECC6B|nr:vitronectin isoform X2 [Choloepus didactylus]
MAPPRPLLLLVLLAPLVLADQESCKGRCTEGFNSERKCQCDELCSYYQSCCPDYTAECKPKVTRGDVFTLPEDEYGTYDDHEQPKNASVPEQPVSPDQLEGNTEQGEHVQTGGETLEPITSNQEIFETPAEEELCSGEPFDAFTDLKNGSLFAFRGKYCYELDEKAVRPGYPKLIQDVWGIEGPIDAAFTRINCQGKTYLFQGSQYWRFDDGVLDPGYPRNISEGFKGIPDDVDAAFALPAHSFRGQERVYFFKGGTRRPQLISKGWPGVPKQVDAAMAGHMYISGLPTRSSRAQKLKSRSRSRKRYHSRRGRGRSQTPRRPSRSFWLSWFSSEESGLGDDNYDHLGVDWLVPASCEPIQSVYFFSGDKYYRVNLRTRRVDTVDPPYPRPIAQYWLGCPAAGGK